MVVPLFVGREKSSNALDQAMAKDKEIVLSAQKKAKTNDPAPEDIFAVGTIGTIIHPGVVRLPDGTVKVLVEGKKRARTKRFAQTASRSAPTMKPTASPLNKPRPLFIAS
jgi:ATP-dependent Lon protease